MSFSFGHKKASFIIVLLLISSIFYWQTVWGQNETAASAETITTVLGEMTPEQVTQLESDEDVQENSDLKIKLLSQVYEDNVTGAALRLIGGIPSPFTYEAPKTQEYFGKIEKVAGTEEEKIKKIYEITTESVPEYGTPENDATDLTVLSTFEDTLSCQKGVCRDQAALLNAALKKRGVDSRMIAGQINNPGDHVWVRVRTSSGEEYDLDPTWYKDFIKLMKRGLRFDRDNISIPNIRDTLSDLEGNEFEIVQTILCNDRPTVNKGVVKCNYEIERRTRAPFEIKKQVKQERYYGGQYTATGEESGGVKSTRKEKDLDLSRVAKGTEFTEGENTKLFDWRRFFYGVEYEYSCKGEYIDEDFYDQPGESAMIYTNDDLKNLFSLQAQSVGSGAGGSVVGKQISSPESCVMTRNSCDVDRDNMGKGGSINTFCTYFIPNRENRINVFNLDLVKTNQKSLIDKLIVENSLSSIGKYIFLKNRFEFVPEYYISAPGPRGVGTLTTPYFFRQPVMKPDFMDPDLYIFHEIFSAKLKWLLDQPYIYDKDNSKTREVFTPLILKKFYFWGDKNYYTPYEVWGPGEAKRKNEHPFDDFHKEQGCSVVFETPGEFVIIDCVHEYDLFNETRKSRSYFVRDGCAWDAYNFTIDDSTALDMFDLLEPGFNEWIIQYAKPRPPPNTQKECFVPESNFRRN